jgi:hypothetical protein
VKLVTATLALPTDSGLLARAARAAGESMGLRLVVGLLSAVLLLALGLVPAALLLVLGLIALLIIGRCGPPS